MQPQQPMGMGGSGMGSGLMGTMATGMALGAGSAVGHRAVDAMLGPRGGSAGHDGGVAGEQGYAPQEQQQQAYPPQ